MPIRPGKFRFMIRSGIVLRMVVVVVRGSVVVVRGGGRGGGVYERVVARLGNFMAVGRYIYYIATTETYNIIYIFIFVVYLYLCALNLYNMFDVYIIHIRRQRPRIMMWKRGFFFLNLLIGSFTFERVRRSLLGIYYMIDYERGYFLFITC